MEKYQLILNSNSLCVICLSEVEAKGRKADLFPLHHLTSKINSNLGNVFKDVTAPNAVVDRLEVLADVCGGCADLCEELLYKFQDDVGRENCIELILDKMEGAGLEDKYKKCGNPSAVFYEGIVDRLRKDIIEKLHLKPELGEKSNQSATGAPAGLHGIPNVLNIPDLPIRQICSYLSFKDIRNCSIVSKGLRRLVFPSFLKSSCIRFQNQGQLTSLIDFIKTISNNIKGNVNLAIDSYSLDASPGDIRSTLLRLFQECGGHINYLDITYGNSWWEGAASRSRLKDNNCLPVLGIGNELFPNLKKLEMDYSYLDINNYEYSGEKCVKDRINHFLAFAKALLRNSPNLRELKVSDCYDNEVVAPLLFKLIGESGLPIACLELHRLELTGSEMGYLEPLNLKKVVVTDAGLNLKDMKGWTKFWESQTASLKHLCFQETGTLPHFKFPRMESLETFKLNTRCIEFNEEVEPISYQNQMPKLKLLEVQEVDKDYLPALIPFHSKPATSVKELRLLLPTLERDILGRSSRLFESLSRLEIHVASYLNDFWKDLSGLEELTLNPKEIQVYYGASEHSQERITWMDEIITGLPLTDSDCGWVTDIRRHEERYEKMETKKSLALLKRLKLLRIRVRDGDSSFSPMILISDICCKVVLIKMESLKCIDFCGAHPSAVGASRNILDEMGKKMDLFFGKKWKRNWTD